VHRLGDEELPPAADHAHRLALDEGDLRPRIVVVERDEPALGLRDDLLGHDHDVAIGERAGADRLGEQRAEVVALGDLADAGDRGDGERAGLIQWHRAPPAPAHPHAPDPP
jgi:hypothetical protein